MAVTIYHNPRCSKSRQTLELISNSGAAHSVVHYLEDMPDSAAILGFAAALQLSVADLLRRGESVFKEADDLPDLSDDAALTYYHFHRVFPEVVCQQDIGRSAG